MTSIRNDLIQQAIALLNQALTLEVTVAPAKVATAGYQLGNESLKKLVGVKTALVEVVKTAITLSEQDFTVYEGLRTLEQQRKNVAKGVSQTLDSMHLPQKDGSGWAVDLVPWIDGHPVWDWDGCYKIAHAMDLAATQLGVAKNIRWGGAWDRTLADFGGDLSRYKAETAAYQARHSGKDFLDGPHFEWRG